MSDNNKKPQGLKSFTKAGSTPVRLAAGGKHYIADTKKKRKYTVKGEK